MPSSHKTALGSTGFLSVADGWLRVLTIGISTCPPLGRSRRLRCPAPFSCQILGPAGAAVGEVIAVADMSLMQLAGEKGGHS